MQFKSAILILISRKFIFQPGNYFPAFITSLKGVETEGTCKVDKVEKFVYLLTLAL